MAAGEGWGRGLRLSPRQWGREGIEGRESVVGLPPLRRLCRRVSPAAAGETKCGSAGGETEPYPSARRQVSMSQVSSQVEYP